MLFRKAFSIMFLTQTSVFFLGILNTILIVRAIGPQGKGIYSILFTSVSILSLISSGGVIWSNTYWVGKDRTSVHAILSNGVSQAGLAFLVLLCLAMVLPQRILAMIFEEVPGRLIYLSIFLIFFEQGILHFNSILIGLQDFVRYNLFSIGRAVLFTLLNAVFLYGFKMNVEGVLYGWIISAVATFGTELFILMKRLHFQRLRTNLLQFFKSIKMGSRALLTNILGQLLLRSDLFLINWYLGLKEVGYYSVGVAVAELVLRIPSVAGDIVFPKVASSDSYQGKVLVTRITRLIGLPLCLGTLILIFNGKSILLMAFGKAFLPAYHPMVWTLFGTVALSYHVIVDNYFAGKGYPAVTIWVPGLSLILNIGLNLLLIPKYGISGAAASTCIAYFFLTAVKFYVFRKENQVTIQEFFLLNRRDLSGMKEILGLKQGGMRHP